MIWIYCLKNGLKTFLEHAFFLLNVNLPIKKVKENNRTATTRLPTLVDWVIWFDTNVRLALNCHTLVNHSVSGQLIESLEHLDCLLLLLLTKKVSGVWESIMKNFGSSLSLVAIGSLFRYPFKTWWEDLLRSFCHLRTPALLVL